MTEHTNRKFTTASARWKAQCPKCGDGEHLIACPQTKVLLTAEGTQEVKKTYSFDDLVGVHCTTCDTPNILLNCRRAYTR